MRGPRRDFVINEGKTPLFLCKMRRKRRFVRVWKEPLPFVIRVWKGQAAHRFGLERGSAFYFSVWKGSLSFVIRFWKARLLFGRAEEAAQIFLAVRGQISRLRLPFLRVYDIMNSMLDWKEIRAAIFDLDGTLIDSMEIWREVDETFFARRGMPVPGGYQEEIAHLGFRECARFTIARYLPREKEEDVIAEWRSLSLSHYNAPDAARYFKPGAVELVRALSAAGLELAVATASSSEFFLPVLRAGGIAGLFGAFTTVDEVGKNKSFPDVFVRSAQKLGVPPAECVVFEDNPTALSAARGAGMRTAAVFDAQPEQVFQRMCAESDISVRSFFDVHGCLVPPYAQQMRQMKQAR